MSYQLSSSLLIAPVAIVSFYRATKSSDDHTKVMFVCGVQRKMDLRVENDFTDSLSYTGPQEVSCGG